MNPQAYEAYLKGRYLFHEWTDESLYKSVVCFKQAIDFDPRYGLAYSALADSYIVLAGHGLMRPRVAYPEAERAARKALELDDTLAEAHSVLGPALSRYERDWADAGRELRRAIDLNPNDVETRIYYGEHLSDIGDAKRAIAETRRALELDPLSPRVNALLGRIFHDSRQFDQAIQQCRNTVELDPNFAHGHWCLGMSYSGKQRYQDAVLELQKSKTLGEGPLAIWALACTYAASGRKADARDTLEQLRRESKDGYVSPAFQADIYAGLGEKDRAFECLNQAYEEGDWVQLKSDPFLDGLHSDPRFHDLLGRFNLAQ